MRTLIFAVCLITSNIALATSPILPPMESLSKDAVLIANLMNQQSVRDCFANAEKGGLRANVQEILTEEYNDASYIELSGNLMGIDTPEGHWIISVDISYNTPPFGLTTYSCETFIEKF